MPTMPRPKDQIWIECAAGRFDRFSKVSISTDIFGEASASFEVADDRAWQSIRRRVQPGSEFKLLCNGLLQFTGRADANELPVTCDSGTTIQVVLRTRMADARIAGCDPNVRTANASLKQFLLALYARVSIREPDFLFQIEADRDIVTGKRGARAAPVDLEEFKADAFKVLATESVFECAKRHLDRHHLMHWDAATGLICVGLPSDTQPPLYRFVQRGGVCNFTEARPVRDWSEIPSSIHILGGVGPSKDTTRASVEGIANEDELRAVAQQSAHFGRRVNIIAEGAKDIARARAQARRELAARSRRKTAWQVTTQDWTHWNGTAAIPYAIATTLEMNVAQHDGTPLNGIFLVTGVEKTLDVDSGTRCTLTTMAQGLIDPTG